MNPISLCMINKNDPAIFDAIKSLRLYVNEVVVVDTGSNLSHQTQLKNSQLIDKFEVFTDCNNTQSEIEDFSKARNHSFSLASNPWIIWCDSDDLIVGGEHLKSIIQQYPNPVSIMFPYKLPSLTYMRERLFHQPSHFQWQGRIHETCNAIDNTDRVQRNELTFQHQPQHKDKIKESGRNLRILRSIKNPIPRELYYLGQEYYDHNMVQEACQTFHKYLSVASWDEEMVQACLKLNNLYNRLQDYKQALTYAFKAINLKPHWEEGYFAAGRTFYFQKDYLSSVNFIKIGLSLPPTETILFHNKMERDFEIHKFYNFALNSIAKVEEALISVNSALSVQEYSQMRMNKMLYEQHLNIKDPL